jgi:diguanylate cyclase (GGDEF)-like protein/PAS domain S-box-containing protein
MMDRVLHRQNSGGVVRLSPSPAVNHPGRKPVDSVGRRAPRKFIRIDWDPFQLADESVHDEEKLVPIFKRDRFEDPLLPKSRLSQEIESVRQKIADLESLERELAQAELALTAPVAEVPAVSSDKIRAEIKNRLGYFPLYLTPAAEFPDLLQSLWGQSLSGYYANPVPALFKERLFLQLARYCTAPYSIVTHSCNLHAFGVSAADILRLIQRPVPSPADGPDSLPGVMSSSPLPFPGWPEPDSELENAVATACILLYLRPLEAGEWQAELRRMFTPKNYEQLMHFLVFVRANHLWLEAHPEISYHSDPQVRTQILKLLRDEPRLAFVFRNYYRDFSEDRLRIHAEEALRASEERYRDLFENANDMVYTMDLTGNLTSLNKAAERITGYSRAEALQMNLAQFVSPACQDVARKMLERQSGSATYEIEIVTREGQNLALEISTHLISREGKPVGVQGIARDITERKKTEDALHQAKQKLEAWVHELEQRTREMTLLSEMGDMLRACLTTEEAYSVIVRVAQQIFPKQNGALYVITASRNLVESVALWGDAALVERVFAPDECWGLRRGRVHWVEHSISGLLCKHLPHPAPEGYLCVPMMAQSEALGVLYLTQPAQGHMTEAKQRLAVTMAEHIAMALSNLKLHETLRSQSIRDPLTGLFNRRFMEESLALELRRAVRNQRPLGVIMLDLDRFKHFNDSFGHDAGDALLRELGRLLQTNIRGEDIACRYGGEEFTLILPEGSAEVTQHRAEALREAIKRMDVTHRGRPLGRLTASMGVAVFPEHGRSAESLLQAADASLYQSKDAGGDTVTTAR